MIAFNRPTIVDESITFAKQVLTGEKSIGQRHYLDLCENWLAQQTGAKKVFLTTSASQALEAAFALLKLKPDDEVILPSFTYVSCANAVLNQGARPVLVDIREDTLALDLAKVEKAITKKTKAILGVHYADLVPILQLKELCQRHGLYLIEDAAMAFQAKQAGQVAGSLGHLACYSFSHTKPIHCGQGGALLVNDFNITEIETYAARGTNRAAFEKGEVDYYSWVSTGAPLNLSELSAAMLFGQLKAAETIQRGLNQKIATYFEGLKPFLPGELPQSFQQEDAILSGSVFYFLVEHKNQRSRLLEHLKKQNIQATFHYINLHDSLAGKKYARRAGSLKISESIAERIIRLPLYNDLSLSEINQIISAVKSYYD